jgi:peptidoglycan-associated lipoprotein
MRRFTAVLGLAMLATAWVSTVAASPDAADVEGRWTGTWSGPGVMNIPRDESIVLELTQNGRRGYGRLVLDGTNAAESVPLSVRLAGAAGTRVIFEVKGSEVVVKHAENGKLFSARLSVNGDQMIGQLRETSQPVYLVLTRATAETPSTPDPMPTAPPQAASAPSLPETTQTSEATPDPAAVQTAAVTETPSSAQSTGNDRPAPAEFSASTDLKTIHFDFNLAKIRTGDAEVLDAHAAWLKAHEDTLVLIEGHCDERGTNEHNLALGERRAHSTMQYLVARGVPASRISVVSYGEERPTCAEHNEQCWSANRRAQFLVKPRGDGRM